MACGIPAIRGQHIFVEVLKGKVDALSFLEVLNYIHPALTFTRMETETDKKLPFLDVLMFREANPFISPIYWKAPANLYRCLNAVGQFLRHKPKDWVNQITCTACKENLLRRTSGQWNWSSEINLCQKWLSAADHGQGYSSNASPKTSRTVCIHETNFHSVTMATEVLSPERHRIRLSLLLKKQFLGAKWFVASQLELPSTLAGRMSSQLITYMQCNLSFSL